MLPQAENEYLTLAGAGTPMGTLLRRFWFPAFLSEELPEPDCPPIRITLMGEALVAFRDSTGQVGLLGQHCPHRGASLFFGRNEECGLRCVYHGWKYDIHGNCVDMPNEPPESNFKDKIRHIAYPCLERGGIVWTYMGPEGLESPAPEFEWATVPASQRYASRHSQECNWLQALEGGIDTSHVPFLHRGARAADPDDWQPDPITNIVFDYHFAPTDYGLMFGSPRPLEGGRAHWSVVQWMMPWHKIIPPLAADAP